MGVLEFKILYNENYISVSNLFEGVGEGSNQDTTHYQNIRDNYYRYKDKGFYYLKRDMNYHKLKIHENCPKIEKYFATASPWGIFIDLPQPVLKGCYPIIKTRQEQELPGDPMIVKTIKNGVLSLTDRRTGVSQKINLPRVVGVEMTGGGGAGGNTGKGDVWGNHYFAAGGGGGGTIIAYLDTYNDGTTINFFIGDTGGPSADNTGTGGAGTASRIKFGDTIIATAGGGQGGGGSSHGTIGSGGAGGTCTFTNTDYFQVLHNLPGQPGFNGKSVSIDPENNASGFVNNSKIESREGFDKVGESPFYTLTLSESITNGYEKNKWFTDYVCIGSGGASAWNWGKTLIVEEQLSPTNHSAAIYGPYWTNSEGIISHTDNISNPYGAGGAGGWISGIHTGANDWKQGHAGYKGRIRLFW